MTDTINTTNKSPIALTTPVWPTSRRGATSVQLAAQDRNGKVPSWG